jgi:hypothetical protein
MDQQDHFLPPSSFNVERIVRDGLSIDQQSLSVPMIFHLTKVTHLSKVDQPWLKNILHKFYIGKGPLPYLGSLLNGVFTENKVTFYAEPDLLQKYFQEDPHLIKFQRQHLEIKAIKKLMTIISSGGFFKSLKFQEDDPEFVYTLMHPDLLKYFYRTMGREALSKQKTQCLQWVRGLNDFENPEPDVREIKTIHHLGMPEEEREKFQNEFNKMQFFKERAISFEFIRLSSDSDPQATLEAVNAANEFRKQERFVLDLELELFRKYSPLPQLNSSLRHGKPERSEQAERKEKTLFEKNLLRENNL